MLYGMSLEEYWNGDPDMAIFYRKKHELICKQKNEEMWLQGAYVFNAFSTALSNLHFDGKNHKINKYLDKPFELFDKNEEEKQNDAAQAKQTVIDRLNRFSEMWNKSKR